MSINPARFLATKLINKSILRVHGSDSLPYLQTFLTNDIRHITPCSGRHCLYSHVINSTGRSLADVFVYQPKISIVDQSAQRNLVLAPFYSEDFGQGGLETDEALIECDNSIADGLRRMLLAMKIRKRVFVEKLVDKQVWVVYPDRYACGTKFPSFLQVNEEVIIVQDPRLPCLSLRIVAPSEWNSSNLQEATKSGTELEVSRLSQYEKYRYQTGISEGSKEHPQGHLFPLECNADLLNGISFKKGLFAGDWITGRNYRKGVFARIVPFELGNSTREELDLVAPDTSLIDSTNYEIGVIRGRRGRIGLASVVCNQLKYNKETTFVHKTSGIQGSCWIPSWWPKMVQRVDENNLPDGISNSHTIPKSQQ